jgi:hypothetical protein
MNRAVKREQASVSFVIIIFLGKSGKEPKCSVVIII